MSDQARRDDREDQRRDTPDGSAILRLLAVGLSPEAVVRRLGERRTPGLSNDDLLNVLTASAAVVRHTSLRAPAEAAFFARTLLPPAGHFQQAPGIDLSVTDTPALRALALQLIETYLGAQDAGPVPDPKHNPMQSAALQYAEALLRQQEILADLEHASADGSSLHSSLPRGDQARLSELLLNRGGPRLDALVHGWRRSVGSVESRPESLAYEDYENALSRRDFLEDAIELLTPASRTAVASLVSPLDAQFVVSTRETSTSIRPRSPWTAQRWWWFRVPRRQSEHLVDRLVHLAPLASREVLAWASEPMSAPRED